MATPSEIARPAKTAGYRPNVFAGSRLGLWLDGRPPFTWLEAERMRYDPQVQFALRILRSPLHGATWKVRADSAVAEQWLQRQSEHVWRRMLGKLVRCFEYGVCGGEVTFTAKRVGGGRTGPSRVHFHDFLEAHPRDMQPFVWNRGPRQGKLASLLVRNVEPKGNVYLDRRHAFWFRGEAEYGDWWGRPRLAGAYSPWFDKAARHAANDMLRLYYRKQSFRGPVMYYPPGVTDMGSPETGSIVKNNQDIAREIVEKFETGGVLALPNVLDDKGNTLWRWEDPKALSDLTGLMDYKKALDRDILIGLGIPPELVDAATVGSGYSGRAIPAQVFFSSMDEFIAIALEAVDRQILRPLCRLNFGKVGYVIEPASLAKQVADGPPQPGAAPGMPAAQRQDQGAGGGPQPYQGPKGGTGTIDPKTGHVSYGQPKPRIRLSWTRYQGPRDGHGWVSDTGEVRYQDAQPADPSTGGPQSVFEHHARQGTQFDSEEPDHASFHGGVERLAAAHGVEPAEAYKAFAGHLDDAVEHAKQWKRPVHKWSAYQNAIGALQAEYEGRAGAAKFADGYWSQPTALRRAAFYLKHRDDLDHTHLDADTLDAVAGDLATLPPAKLAAAVVHAADQHGTDSQAWTIAQKAAADAPAGKPLRFDGAKEGHTAVLTKAECNDDQWTGLVAAARVTPGAAVLADGALVCPVGSPLDKAADAIGSPGTTLDTVEGKTALFQALTTPIQVAQEDVPASAKNYGRVSGHLDPGTVPDDWNANAVDAYRRVNRDWYVVVRGRGHADAGTDQGHAFVRAADVPALARLPDAYWQGYDPAGDWDADAQEQTETRAAKNDPDVIAGRREVTAGGKWTTAKDVVKAFGRLQGEHRQTANLVRRDEAAHQKAGDWASGIIAQLDPSNEPHTRGETAASDLETALDELRSIDPPDHEYDADDLDFEPDTSPLTDSAYSREEKTDHLEDLRTEHRTLAEQVQTARDAAAKASEEYGDRLRDGLIDVRRAAQAVLTLPTAETTPGLRELAEQVNREALRQTGRASREVRLSLTVATPADARRLWDETAGPVLVPVGAAT